MIFHNATLNSFWNCSLTMETCHTQYCSMFRHNVCVVKQKKCACLYFLLCFLASLLIVCYCPFFGTLNWIKLNKPNKPQTNDILYMYVCAHGSVSIISITGLVKHLQPWIPMKSTLLLLLNHSHCVFMCMTQVRKFNSHHTAYLSNLAKQTAGFFYLTRDTCMKYEWTSSTDALVID